MGLLHLDPFIFYFCQFTTWTLLFSQICKQYYHVFSPEPQKNKREETKQRKEAKEQWEKSKEESIFVTTRSGWAVRKPNLRRARHWSHRKVQQRHASSSWISNQVPWTPSDPISFASITSYSASRLKKLRQWPFLPQRC